MNCGCVQIILQVCTRFNVVPSYRRTIHALFQYSERDRSVGLSVFILFRQEWASFLLPDPPYSSFLDEWAIALLSVDGIRFLRFALAQNYDGYWIVVSNLQRYCDANNTMPNLNLHQLAILISLSSLLQQIKIFLKS